MKHCNVYKFKKGVPENIKPDGPNGHIGPDDTAKVEKVEKVRLLPLSFEQLQNKNGQMVMVLDGFGNVGVCQVFVNHITGHVRVWNGSNISWEDRVKDIHGEMQQLFGVWWVAYNIVRVGEKGIKCTPRPKRKVWREKR